MSDANQWNKQIIEEFRANGGKVRGVFENATLVLLHTIGARSGLERVNPLVSITDGDRIVVAASKAGAPSNPDWYYNVVANADVSVEYGAETFKAHAVVAEEPERTRLYDKLATAFEAFAEYQRNTERVIPIVVLERA